MTVVRITCEQLCSFLHDAETRHDIKRTQRGIQSDLPPNCRKMHRQVTPPEALSPGKEAEISGLHSAISTRRLEQIAGLRARGIGDYVDLL